MSSDINSSFKSPNSDLLTVANDIGSLFLQPELSDLTLIVHDQKFAVHKVILAARCQYFRALLFGGLKESFEAEIELQEDTSAEAVEHILKFIYRGSVNIQEMNEDLVIELLVLSHKYGLTNVERHISTHLSQSLSTENIVTILNLAVLYQIKQLCETCLRYLDKQSQGFLSSPELFNGLSESALVRVLSRDSFCASELDIFECVRTWTASNSHESGSSGLLGCVRLALVPLDGLLGTVRASGLFCADKLLDAVRDQNCGNVCLPHRGLLLPDEDLATTARGFSVTRGKATVIDEPLLALHSLSEPADSEGGCIELELGRPSKVNTLQLQLPDRSSDSVSYSYVVEASLDRAGNSGSSTWVVLADFRHLLCRSWQTIHFPAQVIRHIRVRGTRNSQGGRTFGLTAVRVLHSDLVPGLVGPSDVRGVEAPVENVASVARHATVVEGVSRSRNCLLDGETANYDWDAGYTCHQLGNGSICVQLAQPYWINCIRLLLWDLDDRSYSFTVETSVDRTRWTMVADRTMELCSSHQTLHFPPRTVVFVRVIGTYNSANEVFHIVHLEANYEELPKASVLELPDDGGPETAVRVEASPTPPESRSNIEPGNE